MPEVILDLDNPKNSILFVADAFHDINYDSDERVIVKVYHSRNTYIKPEVFPILCSIVNELRANDIKVDLDFETPENCRELSYATRMDFLKTLGVDYPYKMQRREGTSRFITLQKVDARRHHYDGNMDELLKSGLDIDDNQTYDLSLLMFELICNMGIHSKSKNGAYFYCQKYPRNGYIEIHVVDSGVGIVSSMRKNEAYKDTEDSRLLKLSLEYGEGCGEGRGHGLFFVSEFLRRNEGYFHILSGNKGLVIDKGEEREYDLRNYQGTVIHLRIPLNIKVRLDELLSEKEYENV